ncbi:helix-turn-helix domain-containing protein [Fischerella thermalis]|jgi:putative transcriptional regulator|nr:helix-turn-helix domain-containing protein [Fischerella thermalis]
MLQWSFLIGQKNFQAKSIPLDTLEKICLALDCEIGDLLVIVERGK